MKKSVKVTGVREIARRANVSIATVDRVIHNRTGVSAKTRSKINLIIQQLNYQPNILASRLASKRVFFIAVLIPGISVETLFWEVPLKGIERATEEIKQYGIQLKPYFFDLNDKDSFTKQAGLILENKIDGVLLSPSFVEESVVFIQACKARNIPYVFIDSNIPGQGSLSYIGPHLFKSGYLGAKLLTYALGEADKVLVVNISKEIDGYIYLEIEKGFRAYFKEHQHMNGIIRTDIKHTDYQSIATSLSNTLNTHPDISAIFVTNSRVFSVARFLEEKEKSKLLLVGYDLIGENIDYLKKGTIDFLICHKPEEQGYRGVMAFYQKLVMASSVEKVQYMPIDIITRENYEFYHN